MEDQYGMVDLREYISGRPLFRPIPQPPEFLSGHPPNPPYGMLMFRSDSNNSVTTANAAPAGAAIGGGGVAGGRFIAFESGGSCSSSGRWPRQETLTLLEIRSRLDSKFKEANQKGPLWDEVSRIMSEEHGYQRSGKKCREKFENLYKYYKKTKEGKAGGHDGKHYRFFRQLEAIYGDPYNSNSASASGASLNCNFPNKNSSSMNKEAFQARSKLSDTSLSLSNYSDGETSSSADDDSDVNDNNPKTEKIRGKRGWKVKIRDFIDDQMKRLMDKQEAWMEKMMKTIEDKEKERLLREDEWRKQDATRIERERELWATERVWIEARDAALMEALHKLTGNEANPNDEGGDQVMANSVKGNVIWPECEVNRLIELRSEMDVKFQQRRVSEQLLWEEISREMGVFGHQRSGVTCKEKWESVNSYPLKKRKENSNPKGCMLYDQLHEGLIPNNQGGLVYTSDDTNEQGFDDHMVRVNEDCGNSIPTAGAMNDHCYRYLLGDAYARILD